jgi:hypothetical protein
MRHGFMGEEPFHSQESRVQDKDEKKARTYEPERIDILLEVGRDFEASLKNDVLIHSISIETGADYRQGVVGDEEKIPDKQAWPQIVEKEIGQSGAPDTALVAELEVVLYE